MQLAKSQSAAKAYELVCSLQEHFAAGLAHLSDGPEFHKVEWVRASGAYGGGHRRMASEDSIFNRASVNVSQVQYEDNPDKKLNSATALSTIVHPKNPVAPSLHLHISWTEFKEKPGTWRIMADLNPSNKITEDQKTFDLALSQYAGEHFKYGVEQGEKYFFIPALDRHRGVSHFYLEGYNSQDFAKDHIFAHTFGFGMIDTYLAILGKRLKSEYNEDQSKIQMDYHTLYFFQVLTLDRGTTAGLLVHSENDVGILGSLPRYINVDLLGSWKEKMAEVPRGLLDAMLGVLPKGPRVEVNDPVKEKLCEAVRGFYQKQPAAMEFLARGDILPMSNQNHSNQNL